jgi:hypothetical protein
VNFIKLQQRARSVRASLANQIATYVALEPIDLHTDAADAEHAILRLSLFVLLPAWMVVGLLDWYWHKDTDIEHTSGIKESLIHALMFTEVGVPILMTLFLELNAGTIIVMLGTLGLHETTAFWDVGYAVEHREVKTREQHTHSFLEALPVMALALVCCLHPGQLHSLLGSGPERPRYGLKMKNWRLPKPYLLAVAGMIVIGLVLPYSNEILRCYRSRNEPHYNSGFYSDGKRISGSDGEAALSSRRASSSNSRLLNALSSSATVQLTLTI